MTFGFPWLAPLALAPLIWAALEWRNSARKIPLVLKAAVLAAILLALSQPRVTVYESKVGLAILVDTSPKHFPAGFGRGLKPGHQSRKRPRPQLDPGAALRQHAA